MRKMYVNVDLDIKVTATCAKCKKDIELNDVNFSGRNLEVSVNPHNCSIFDTGGFYNYIKKEAEASGEDRIVKWLEMKKLEYELKNNIV